MTEHDLLEWLSKEDDSSLGECNGPLLDALVAKGLAEIIPAPDGIDPRYGRVRLSEAGWQELKS